MYFENLKKFFKYYIREERKSLIAYIGTSYIASILEFFGIAIVYPFVLLLLKPDLMEKLPIQVSPLILGCSIFVLFILKNIFMIYCLKKQAKISKNIEVSITKQLIKFFLLAPYSVTSKIPRAKKERIVFFLVPESINNFLLRFLNLNINLAIICMILLLVFIKLPIPAFFTSIFAIFVFILQNKIYKPILLNISQVNSHNTNLYQKLKDSILSNLKLIKISGLEASFEDKIDNEFKVVANSQAKFLALNSSQPYILEPFIIILLFLMLALIYYTSASDTAEMIASFSLVASAIFRFLPALSRVQVSLNSIAVTRKHIKELNSFYEDFIKNYTPVLNDTNSFNNSIQLKIEKFEYEKNSIILKDIDLKINKNSFIGIVGASGSGKTTIADILTGLLPLDKGSIIVDGKLSSGIRNMVGYVPQESVFFNASIRENIALGQSKIDDSRVEYLLRAVGLYEFIKNKYPDGIYAKPFTDSVGFSQGQKQRLSIARALYNNPQILILDEATSALDLETENEICELFLKLKKSVTIIAIAHRLSTLKNADNIIFIKDSTIKAEGSFESLNRDCAEFRNLLALQKLSTI